MFVLDSSAAIEFIIQNSLHAALSDGTQVYAPDLLDIELTHVLRTLVRRDRMSPTAAETIIAEWCVNDVIRCAHVMLLPRIWHHRENITAYDATYVALAELLGIPLVTADRRLAKAAREFCEVVVVG